MVSILMSVYNGEKFISETIDSVLLQSFNDFEFIIIDDGSTDGTYKILEKSYSRDKKIIIIKNETNIGLTGSLNKGIHTSRGEFIARIDCGDVWEKEKLKLQMEYLKKNPDVILLGASASIIDERGNQCGIMNMPSEDRDIRIYFFKSNNPFIHSAVIFKKNTYYDENYAMAQDFELWSRLYFQGKLANLDKKLLRYRYTSNSISYKNRPAQIFICYKIYNNFIRVLKGKKPKRLSPAEFAGSCRAFSYLNYKGNWMKTKFKPLGFLLVFLSYCIYPRLLFIKVIHSLKIVATRGRFRLNKNKKTNLSVIAVIPAKKEEANSMLFTKRQTNSLRENGIRVIDFYLTSRSNPLRLFKNLTGLSKEIKRNNISIIHAHFGTVTSFFCAIVSLLTRRPLVITFHGSDINKTPHINGYIRDFFERLLSQLSALKAKKIICVSEKLKENLWWKKNIVDVVPMGVDIKMFRPMSKSKMRKKLKWNTKENVILFHAGKYPQNKRLDLAEKALAKAKNKIPGLRLEILWGDTDYEDIPLLLNASDCLLLTSEAEGSPMMIKEAMACNIPIVSVDVGDVKERLDRVHPTVIVDREADSLASGILEITELNKRSNGRHVIKEFSEENITKRIIDIYHNINE